MVREELQRDKLREKASARTWGYEKRMEEGKGSRLVRMCWEEIKERGRKGKEISNWEKERKTFFEDRGVGLEELEKKREEEEARYDKIWERDKVAEREKRWERIRNSEYNKWYGKVKGKGISEYLKKEWGESR